MESTHINPEDFHVVIKNPPGILARKAKEERKPSGPTSVGCKDDVIRATPILPKNEPKRNSTLSHRFNETHPRNKIIYFFFY